MKIKSLQRRIANKLLNLSDRLGLRLKKTRISNYIIGRYFIDIFLWPADLTKVTLHFKDMLGKYPNILKPKSFSEKLQYTKLFRRKYIYTQFADKIAVRDYVTRKIGDQYLTELYWTGHDLLEAKNLKLPFSFIIKPNHSSGKNIIVRNADQFDWYAAHKQTERWLKKDFSFYNAEWQYRWIKPNLLIEELLLNKDGDVPLDYKFFCFNGKVELVQVDYDRFTSHTRSLFDRHFNLLPVGLEYPKHQGASQKPGCYKELLRLAEVLSDNEPFLRVDFYDIGRPVFGELTLHPGSGIERFNPYSFDEKLGILFKKSR